MLFPTRRILKSQVASLNHSQQTFISRQSLSLRSTLDNINAEINIEEDKVAEGWEVVEQDGPAEYDQGAAEQQRTTHYKSPHSSHMLQAQ